MIVIEHNLEVIKTADWIIDMGPEGGNGGGQVVAQGTPEDVAKVAASYTGRYLKEYLKPPAQRETVAAKKTERKSGVEGKSVEVRVEPGGSRIIKTKKKKKRQQEKT